MWTCCRQLLLLLAVPSLLCSQSYEQLLNNALRQLDAHQLDSAETLVGSVLDSSAHPKPDTRAVALMLHGVISFYRACDSTAAAAFHDALELRLDLRGEWLAHLDPALWKLWRRERCHVISGPSEADIVMEDSAALTEKPRVVSGPHILYPEGLRHGGVQGRVRLIAVIDTAGRAEQGSVRILESPHPDFSREARQYLERARFRSARMGDQAVRVCVELPVDFKIRGRH